MNQLGTLAYLLPQASSVAGDVDMLAAVIMAVAIFFSVGVFVAIIFLSARYRRGNKVDRSRPPQYDHILEFTWTTIPLAICLGMFVWSTVLFFHLIHPPAGAMEVHVVGKQWMWKLQQPSGKWEMNQLHVPAGRPVILTMTSEDVIHAFFIPAFRVKKDVIPGQFTQLWFTANQPGEYHLFCAEFCGTEHSGMTGTVFVMEPGEYEKWLSEGDVRETVAAEGARLFRKHGCSGCHGTGSSVRAPLLEGIYGRPIPVQIPQPGVPLEKIKATTLVADTRYIHDAIVLPEQEVAAGFKPIMPSFKNRITEEEILKLVAYIRSMERSTPPEERRRGSAGLLSEEDYKARTGFVPKNIENLKRGVAGGSPSTVGTPGAPAPAGPGAGATGGAGGGERITR